MAFKIHRAARAEANAAAAWYAERDEAVALRFTAEVDRAFGEIELHPERWPLAKKDRHRFRLRDFPYAIIYRIIPNGVRVLAVAHTRRDPWYWQKRQ